MLLSLAGRLEWQPMPAGPTKTCAIYLYQIMFFLLTLLSLNLNCSVFHASLPALALRASHHCMLDFWPSNGNVTFRSLASVL